MFDDKVDLKNLQTKGKPIGKAAHCKVHEGG
jgi:hypothetical protein